MSPNNGRAAPQAAPTHVELWCAECGAHAKYRCQKHGDYLCAFCRYFHDIDFRERCVFDSIPALAEGVPSEA